MSDSTTKGRCRGCGNDYTKRGFGRHLAACPGRTEGGSQVPGYRLRVEPVWGGPYFLDLEMPGSARLGDLDDFLRAIWLECCGHLSWFEDPENPRDLDWDGVLSGADLGLSMAMRLDRVLRKGKRLHYTYDAGSSTELWVRAAAAEPVPKKGAPVRLLARNHPVTERCSCGKVAVRICNECRWDEFADPLLCADCFRDHECGEEVTLPLVNSPRCGECGYTGPERDFWA